MLAHRVLVLAALAIFSPACGKRRVQPGAIPPAAPAELTTPEGAQEADDADDEDDDDEDVSDDGFGPAPSKASPATPAASGAPPAWAQQAAAKLAAHAKGKRRAWDRLAELADRFGPRPAGSKALEAAIDWSVETMRADGLSAARREKVMVPNWRRGEESLQVVAPTSRELTVLGLGGTVGTRGTLRAELLVVGSLDELDKRAAEAKGKIVLVNQKMPPYDHDKDESGYGTAVRPRGEGASRAAKHGAVGLLIRSVTAVSLDTPHTGAMRYSDDAPKIPAAAVTVEGAEFLARSAARGPVKLAFARGAKTGPDVASANAIAELRGREKPEEIVVIGGHIDSWDVGDGSSDDGAGCVMAMEAALMLRELGLVPRRTIRVVLFTNEEFGLRGGKAYFEAHGKEPHVAAIESDSGAGAPRGFGVAGDDAAKLAAVKRFAPVFTALGAGAIDKGWGGADISPLTEAGVLSLSLRPEGSRYFDVHHSPADTVEKIDPDHLQANAAAFALMAYILAERE
ncbi:MAG: M20/M25/M40 family metallo-hydrolase [Myxococcales bacterium]|nr:M20/M25/M40 family metallo-hydrolase [Myxococcales bacterium]